MSGSYQCLCNICLSYLQKEQLLSGVTINEKAYNMEYVKVRSLTKEALKEWLLKQGVPQEQVDAFHGMLKRVYTHMHIM